MTVTDQIRAAVVTGAGSGIGRALAVQLAHAGSRVACADIDEAAAHRTAAALQQDGHDALAVHCDVADLAQVEDLADRAEEALGPVDLVVNNAGIGHGGYGVGDERIETWRRTIDVNLWGVIHGCHVFTPRFRARNRGGIINVASAAGFAAAPGMGPYNVSKAAVVSLSETMAAELAGTGVTVTVVCPTFVRTNIVSSGEIDPDHRAAAERLMALTGRSADDIATTILRGHAAGRTYVVPQLEARAVWAAKRHAPRTYLAGTRLLSRMLRLGRAPGAEAVDVTDTVATPAGAEEVR